ncbi:T9SS type A sorting domain-containing protein [Taibaiella soli]|uniref:Secretion system C-terminal sorting domain-containing protein n=1 Tax=Taibaiella soli TaxID=1649169 RepID=A0A2W2AWJ5_9BACT|nr:T9SS type A sorting domain-containing protein [Taibaiella soli]PZF72344.1 hypothetical protein DN068_13390 [Taibaiella soli]
MSSSATHLDNVVKTTNGRRPIFANLFTKGSSLKHKALFLCSALTLFVSYEASATIYFSNATGNWSSLSSWAKTDGSGGTVSSLPGAADTVVIRGGNNITVDVSTAVCGVLRLSSIAANTAGTITFAAASQLAVSGDVIIGGSTGQQKGTIVMTAGGMLQIGGGVTINSLNSFTAGAGTIAYSGGPQTVSNGLGAYNNLTLSGSGNKTTTGITVNGTLSLQGNALVGNSFTYGTNAILEYKGGSAQTTANNEFPATMNAKVVINNAAGVTLNATKTLGTTSTLTLTSGKLNVGNDTLTISNSSATAVTASSSNYIVLGTLTGRLAYPTMTTATYTFPVGNSTYYLPATVAPASTPSGFSVGVFQGATMNGTPLGTPYTASAKKAMVDAMWDVARTNGSSSAAISLTWDPALVGETMSGSSGINITISHFSGGWQNATASASNTTTTAFATFSSFSPFGVSLAATPLPIVLEYFNGSVVNGNAVLQWAMGNNDARQILMEKSTDGKSFGTLAQIAVSNTNAYEYKDAMGAGANNYYRLKMVDNNGTVTYSNVVNLKTNKFGSTPITISPNPAKDLISVVYPLTSSEATLNIVDMQGRVVYKQIVATNTDQGDVNISTLPAGIYVLRMDAGVSQIQQLFYHQ